MTKVGRSPPPSPSSNGSGVFPGVRLRRYSWRLTCGLSPSSQRVIHQPDDLRRKALHLAYTATGDKPVEGVESPLSGGQDAHDPVLLAPTSTPLVRIGRLDLLERLQNRVFQQFRGA